VGNLINVEFENIQQSINDLKIFLNQEVIAYSSNKMDEVLNLMDTMEGKTNEQQKNNILIQKEKVLLLAQGLLCTLEFMENSSKNMKTNDLILGNSIFESEK